MPNDNGVSDKKPVDLMGWLRGLLRGKSDDELRDALEDYIGHLDDNIGTAEEITAHERVMITNVLELRKKIVVDVMVPRADIIAVHHDVTQDELFALLAEKQFSRFPVYRENLDHILGTVHIKDIMAQLANRQDFDLAALVRDVPIISPALPMLDLILQMRATKKHMALVIDEHGGIDGLVTIGDVIEAILGAIDDEYSSLSTPALMKRNDGTLIVDARYEIQEFEKEFGAILSDDEREDIDTFGGLAFALAGRVPGRGEILIHEGSGLSLEVLDADPRRVHQIRLKTTGPMATDAQRAA